MEYSILHRTGRQLSKNVFNVNYCLFDFFYAGGKMLVMILSYMILQYMQTQPHSDRRTIPAKHPSNRISNSLFVLDAYLMKPDF